jgi:hypothetical protein
MKNISLIAVCLLALSLVFLGCDNNPSSSPDAFTHDLGGFNLLMADNFQWGDGYQGTIERPALFAGNQVREGDVFNLKITFTVGRDLEEELYVGLVDRLPIVAHWAPLTWSETEGDGEPYFLNGDVADDEILKAGKTYSFDFDMVALSSATNATALANSLAFQTAGEGTPGEENSGVQKPFNIIFTEFVFSRK